MPVRTWGQSTGSWFNPNAWVEASVPTSGDDVGIDGGDVTITAAPANANSVQITNQAALNVNEDLSVTNTLLVAALSGAANLFINGGITTAGSVAIGYDGFGIVRVSGSGRLTSGAIAVGGSEPGILSVSAGGRVNSTGTVIVGGGSSIVFGGTSAPATSGTVNANINLGANDSQLTFQTTDTASYDGVVSGAGRINQLSAGRIAILTGNNTNSGTTTISAGTLQIGNGGIDGSLGSGAIANSGMLDYNRVGAFTVGNAISGAGAMQFRSGGQVTLTGANTTSGQTTIASGTQVRVDSNLGTGNIVDNGLLHLNNSMTYGGMISGSGALQSSGGTIVLTGNNSYSGTTTVSGGTLQVGNGGGTGTLGTSAIVLNSSQLTFNRSGASYTIANQIVGASAARLRFEGGATATLTANNDFAGTTEIQGGMLALSTTGSLANSALSVLSGGIFDISGINGTSRSLRDIKIANGGQVNLDGFALYVTDAFNNSGSGAFVGTGFRVGRSGADAVYFTLSANALNFAINSSFSNWESGPDTITLTGNASNNILIGAALEITSIYGGEGADTITGGINDDYLYGNEGDDTLNGGDGNDQLYGDENNDTLTGGAGNDLLHGGDGIDTASYATSTGGVTVNLSITAYQNTGSQGLDQLVRIENLTGSAFADTLIGNLVNNRFDLSGGSDDTVYAGGGDDVITFGAALTAADSVDGDSGNDQLGITGNYTGANALVFTATTVTNVEVIACLPGGSYDLTLHDATTAAGTTLTLFGGNLGAADNFKVDASAETNGTIITYGGLGTDTITGGAGSDGFYFGPNKWGTSDSVVGGAGANDQLALDGSYTLTIGASADVEVLVLLAGPSGSPNSYNIGLSDSWTASGETKIVFARQNTLGVTINGSVEAGGNFIFFGGRASDTLTTGGGNDQIYGLEGNDVVIGGSGSDTAVYQGLRASYSVFTDLGIVGIIDNDAATDGNDGQDSLVGVEFARFSDQTISLTSPIILDLDGGGVETLSAEASNAAFDMDGDGIGDDTSWFGRGEGLLFLDRDGNGTVSNAGEFSFVEDKPGARSDLEGLAAFDSNGDGQLSKADVQFKSFKIWQDRNGNGVVDAREIMTLKQAGVRSLSLTGTNVSGSTALGDTAIVNTGSFIRTNGRTGGLVDAVLTAFSSKGAGDQSAANAMLATDDPLTAMRDSMASDSFADTIAPAANLDPRIALMAQDMASFGAGGAAVTELDRWRRQGTAQVELFAA